MLNGPRSSSWHSSTNGKSHGGELTPRQRDVAGLIADGLTNDQIARRLWITTGTVANHVAHILFQLGLQSRVQVATWMAGQHRASEVQAVVALLERLREVTTTDLTGALQYAAEVLASVFVADKVDAMLCDPPATMLVTVGTSDTPMSKRQRDLGLDRLPLAQGGRAVWVLGNGQPFQDGHVEQDTQELPGIRHDLGVRSTLMVRLEVTRHERGVLVASSAEPERFSDIQLQLLQFVAYWVGLVIRDHSKPEDSGRTQSRSLALRYASDFAASVQSARQCV
jgi:DNA-binding CsgD family transcriptional regulator